MKAAHAFVGVFLGEVLTKGKTPSPLETVPWIENVALQTRLGSEGMHIPLATLLLSLLLFVSLLDLCREAPLVLPSTSRYRVSSVDGPRPCPCQWRKIRSVYFTKMESTFPARKSRTAAREVGVSTTTTMLPYHTTTALFLAVDEWTWEYPFCQFQQV